MAFYLKYRPQKIDDLDLASVRDQLNKIVASKSIPHALLFSGPKGTGKTSAARILAKVVNCTGKVKVKPCNKCLQCTSIMDGSNVDVVEIDAASHRGIDDIRSLREAVKLASSSAEIKVYIIDEAHMLTTEASNALLKTLEEPPEHVMFILATTNPEKLIDTIRSRSTNVVFTKATSEEMMRSLGSTVKKEKIKIDDNSLVLIAKASDGSFRDAEKVLEQVLGGKKTVSQKAVKEFLKDTTTNIESLIDYLSESDATKALAEVETFVSTGGQITNLIGDLESVLRSALLAKSGIESKDIKSLSIDDCQQLLELLLIANSQLKNAHIEQLPLELAIVKWCKGNRDSENEDEKIKPTHVIQEPKKPRVTEAVKPSTENRPKKDRLKIVDGNPMPQDLWAKVLQELRPSHFSLEALLRSSKPIDYDGNTLTIGVYYKFHKERIEENQHKVILEQTIEKILGKKVRIYCQLTEPLAKTENPPKQVVLTETEKPLTDERASDIINVAKEIFNK